ncbi:MAG TPA: tyrosine-protein phosphatase [Pyrinomonadaceae bacterium]|nr:tyrosine-protein phosphatase [Pyrinomonadaceae bacterium]
MRYVYYAVLMLAFLSMPVFAQNANADLPPRFQQVNERLYRSGQPREGSLSRLSELGINTIINLRGTSERTKAEEAAARALGLNYFNVALPNWGRPQDARVDRVLQIIAAPESGRVLVHCKDGVDRTGMIVALHRMMHEGWTKEQALAEAERSGMRRIQVWMRDYAEDYGDRVHKLGPQTSLTSPAVHEDFDDLVGDGMRVVERETFRARKFSVRFLKYLFH